MLSSCLAICPSVRPAVHHTRRSSPCPGLIIGLCLSFLFQKSVMKSNIQWKWINIFRAKSIVWPLYSSEKCACPHLKKCLISSKNLLLICCYHGLLSYLCLSQIVKTMVGFWPEPRDLKSQQPFPADKQTAWGRLAELSRAAECWGCWGLRTLTPAPVTWWRDLALQQKETKPFAQSQKYLRETFWCMIEGMKYNKMGSTREAVIGEEEVVAIALWQKFTKGCLLFFSAFHYMEFPLVPWEKNACFKTFQTINSSTCNNNNTFNL